ncbi:glycosyltransferase [Francisella philomiragia]|uniref:glycosyltransferase family 2 protein n=1 Tax=Francisella philomiragia TaxID=28110 RepID=UPI000B596A82|nr:glycosyltransferase family 2 protein [Francisella philomiragia]MBK2094781.1 glycosyltransferase [Francisella philomiragia]
MKENNIQNIKFTVITVCYNSEKTIQKTLRSIKDQTYKNIEYIIIDGGSTDKTLEIINNYKDIVDILISEPDNGIYDAMNKGIKLATGDYIGFLNSDDYYTNDIFEEYNIALIKEIVDYIYSDTVFYNINKSWSCECDPPESFKFANSLHKGTQFCHQTLYVKREVFNKVGLFDTSFKISADYDFFLRLFNYKNNYFKGVYLSKKTCFFKMGGTSSSFLKTRVDELNVKLKNGYPPLYVYYIFFKVSFFYLIKKLFRVSKF